MLVIPLSSEFIPAVLDGRKLSTIRLGRRPYPRGPCVLRAKNWELPIEIHNVRFSRLDELTQDDAHADGFTSLEELQKELRRFYPSVGPNDFVTIVEFVKK
jgi:hypothetical protein